MFYNCIGDNMNKQRIIFHIDVNNAFLSWSAVKMLDEGYKTDIRTIPSIIGGDESQRKGVVLAKSPVAKKYGIKTAETIYSARRKCSKLKIFPADHDYYKCVSNNLFQYLKEYSPAMEQLSIDECFLDMSNMNYIYKDLEQLAYDIKDDIKKKFNFTVNIGIANNKLCAKMASDFEKPDKVHTLYNDEVEQKLWPLPVNDLYMVGNKSCEKLKNMGIRTIGDLAKCDAQFLTKKFGIFGKTMWEYANGIDDSKVYSGNRTNKCISVSETFSYDINDSNKLKKILLRQTENVARSLRNKKMYAKTVALTIKTYDFVKYSKQTKLNNPTNITEEIYQAVIHLFNLSWNKVKIRSIGVRLSDFTTTLEQQISLFDNPTKKDDHIGSILDNIKDKYGDNIIMPASLFDKDNI